jgi:hypothetical protein
MFPIPWRLVVGVVLGAVLVKEFPRVSKFYDSVKERVTELFREANRKWSAAEPPSGSAVSEACGE